MVVKFLTLSIFLSLGAKGNIWVNFTHLSIELIRNRTFGPKISDLGPSFIPIIALPRQMDWERAVSFGSGENLLLSNIAKHKLLTTIIIWRENAYSWLLL